MASFANAGPARALEQANNVSFLRGPYNLAFYHRHNYAYRVGAGMHFFHSKQHDLLQLTPLAKHTEVDATFAKEAMGYLTNPPRTEPEMNYYSSHTDRAFHTVLRAIDWTHMHHEQTYDILADRTIAWADKKAWTDKAVRYYLTKQTNGVPRSPAPLDVTMRRAGVMMKPYFTYFRNYYPQDQALFFVAHWWHPAVYEALMLGGNRDQEPMVKAVADLMWREVVPNKPSRMVLSREVMPRYSRMSPESANIFDNLHMLHGIVYDILAYEPWTVEQKRAELYRFIAAMSAQPGDDELARKFAEPHPDQDPRVYPAWMASPEGEMSRIMMEMMEDMMPMMMPGATDEMRQKIMVAMKQKMTIGLAPGETPGSFADALKAIMPDMKLMPGAMEPGETPTMMVDTMLAGWRRRYGDMPDIAPLDMSIEPTLAAAPRLAGL